MAEDKDTEVIEQEDPTSGLQKALKAERQQRKQFESRLKEFEARFADVDPDEYHSLKESLDSTAKSKEEVELQYKAKLRTTEEKYARERDEWRNKYESQVRETALKKAFRAAGGRDDQIDDGFTFEDLAVMVAERRTKMKDGEIVVLDASGEESNLTLADLFKELSSKGATADYFKSQNTASGSAGYTTPAATVTTARPTGRRMTLEEIKMNVKPQDRERVAREQGYKDF